MPIWHDSVCPHVCLAGSQTSCRPRFPCVRGPRSTLCQCRCLPSCSTEGFPTSANFESNHSELIWSLEVVDSQIIMNMPVTNVPWCIGSNVAAAPAVSWYGSEQRISRCDTRSPSWDEWAAYTAPDWEIVSPSLCAWSVCINQVSPY